MPYQAKKNGLRIRPTPGKAPFAFGQPPPQPVWMEPPARPERAVRTGAGAWPWVMAAVVGIWMFGLGVVVGRYTVPVDMGEDIGAELERLRAEELREDRERMAEAGEVLDAAPFGFYDALVQGDPGVPPPAPRLPETAAAQAEPSEMPIRPPEIKRALPKNPSIPAARSPEPPAAEASAPVPRPKPVPEPAPAPARTSPGRYYVQLASFMVPADADRLVATLRGKGYESVFVDNEPDANNIVRYRVRIGHFRTYADGQEILARIKSRERIHDAFVSKD